MSNDFQHLLYPGRIGTMEIPNRMIVSAMGVNLAEEDGSCGDRLIAFHEEHAKGGAGMIVLGTSGVAWPHGGNQPRQAAISDDSHIPGLRRLADAVHKHGSKLATQLHFGGLVSVEDMKAGRPVWIPSYPTMKASDMGDGMLPEEADIMGRAQSGKIQLHLMDKDDIATLVDKFAKAAGRAKEAGLDGVEIHGGHGYIISEFLSPNTNNRDDEYGGSLANRARFLLEVIAAVRATVGIDYPVWCKLDVGEYGKNDGISYADARTTALMAQAAGVDAITASAYHDTSKGALHSESNIPHIPERMVDEAKGFKAVLDIPVIASGRIEPKSAESHIQNGDFDFLGMGRKMLADPHLPRKLAEGRAKDIRPCIYCYCCVSQIYIENPIKCAVNPDSARENESSLIPATNTKHIVVIGGGPAGMESARRLSLRGHEVTLLESGPRLGGTLEFASIPYEPNERLLHWLRRQIARSNVNVQLKTTATPEYLKLLKPDEVVVATGAKRNMPEIPGADRNFVFSGDEMRAMVLAQPLPSLERKTDSITRFALKLGAISGVTAKPAVVRAASHLWLPLSKNIVIIGGELVGLELAEFLAHRGRKVTVLEPAEKPGRGLYLVRRLRLLDELRHLNVELINGAAEFAILDKSVSYHNFRGQQRRIDADQVIVAMGATGDNSVSEMTKTLGLVTHTIGDCTGVSYIEGAMHEAAKIASGI